MVRPVIVLGVAIASLACAGESEPSPAAPGACAVVPDATDWAYVGTVLEAGDEGAFDRLLWGGFGGSAVLDGNTLRLYYQGASHYSEAQQSVAVRAIGLATSVDGATFAKDPGNPVLAWSPRGGEEEGVASVAVASGEDGGWVAFYGANSQSGPTAVVADARWATSTDGRSFVDRGVALSHDDPGVAGSGDEIFPVAAVRHGATWIVWYIPNGVDARARLHVATGPAPDALRRSAVVEEPGGAAIRAWGMQSVVRLCGNSYALFANDVATKTVAVRLLDARSPERVGAPVASYRFPPGDAMPGLSQGVVALDRDRGRWLLLYRSDDAGRWALRTAPLVVR